MDNASVGDMFTLISDRTYNRINLFFHAGDAFHAMIEIHLTGVIHHPTLLVTGVAAFFRLLQPVLPIAFICQQSTLTDAMWARHQFL